MSATNVDAKTVLTVVDTTTGTEVALPTLPNGDVTGTLFSRDEKKIGLLLTSNRTPRDLWVLDIGGGEPSRLRKTEESIAAQEAYLRFLDKHLAPR